MNDKYNCTDEDGLNVIELKHDGNIQVTCLTPDRKKDGLELNVIVGKHNPAFDDGPTQSGVLHSSVGIACRESSVYIAEHPTDLQGFIRLFQYLAGLKEVQSIWHLVSKVSGMVSGKRDVQIQMNQMKRNISKLLNDAKDVLQLALMRLGQLIGKISTLHGNVHLDIYERNTSSSSSL